MQYPLYKEYKDSGYKLVGEIPEHWEARKLKFMASIQNGRDYKHVESDDGYDVIGSGGAFIKATEYLYDGESVLFGRKGTIDTPLYINRKFWTVDTMFYSIIHEGTVAKYLYYCATVMPFKYLATQTALPSITQFDLENYFLPYPVKNEQQIIADFLDYKTQQIDQLIEKKKSLIEKLNEQRIAIITQAVTKGLDKNAKMKPSGVDWLGDVPAHWDVKRLRFCIISNPVKSEIKDLKDDDLVSFVPMEAVKEYGGMDLSQTRMLDEVYNGYTYFKEKDVVVAKITPCFENGKGSIAQDLKNGIGFGTTEFHVLRGLESMDEEYLFYLTISFPFRKNGEAIMVGAGGHKRISEDYVKDYRQGIPGKEEQRKIVNYIKTRLSEIDKMVDVNKKIVERYEEYRSAIITDAVTGKIDVRDIEVPAAEDAV